MIFDGHSDILTDVVIKRLQGDKNILNKYHLPKLKKGNIEGSSFVFWIDTPAEIPPSERLKQLMQATKDEFAECSDVALVRNISEITQAKNDGKFYIFLGMEGLSPIGEDLSKLYTLYDFGIRHIMMTWNEENPLATGVRGDENRGVTKLGKQAINIMEDKGILLDVSHLNYKSFSDVAKMVTKPIVASHSNAKELCNVSRNLTDEQLLFIRDMNGVVGLNSYKNFIHNKNDYKNIFGLVEQAKYIAYKIGVEHLSLGFDFLDFLEDDEATHGLEDCTKVPYFIELLKNAGFNKNEIELISCGNWLRVIKEITD